MKFGGMHIWISILQPTHSLVNIESQLDEYTIFLEEFQKNPNTTWIVKPNNKSQGQGIFLLKKINQLKKIVPGANFNAAFKNFNIN